MALASMGREKAPAVPELECHRQHGDCDDGKHDQCEVLLHKWQVAEVVASTCTWKCSSAWRYAGT